MAGRLLLLTVRRPTSGVAEPLGDLSDLFRAPPQDFFVALGDEPPTCRARDGVAVSLEPRLASVEFIPAMWAHEMQRGGELVGYRPYSWHWLNPSKMIRTVPLRQRRPFARSRGSLLGAELLLETPVLRLPFYEAVH